MSIEMRLANATLDLVISHMIETTGLPDPHSPDEMLDAVAAASASHTAAELSLRRWVHAARRAGASWQAIGDRLGSTRQAAQQRFGSPSTLVPVGIPARGERTVIDFAQAATIDRLVATGWAISERAYPYANMASTQSVDDVNFVTNAEE